jgi:hypothetical protein
VEGWIAGQEVRGHQCDEVDICGRPVIALEKVLFGFVDAIMPNKLVAMSFREAGRKMTTRLGSNCLLIWLQTISSSMKLSLLKIIMRD